MITIRFLLNGESFKSTQMPFVPRIGERVRWGLLTYKVVDVVWHPGIGVHVELQ